LGTHTHITCANCTVFVRLGGTQSTTTLYRATYMTFEDYRNNKTKNRTSENKTFKFISVQHNATGTEGTRITTEKYLIPRMQCQNYSETERSSKWERKKEYRTLTKHHKLYDYISLYIMLLKTVSSTIYLKRNISVANGKELFLIINKTHAGNYNRLLKIKK